jgi:hypothetical protein
MPIVSPENDMIYRIGNYFWIDGSNGGADDGVYQKGIEEPTGGVLVKLLNGDGTKLYWMDATHKNLTAIPNDKPAETHTGRGGWGRERFLSI